MQNQVAPKQIRPHVGRLCPMHLCCWCHLCMPTKTEAHHKPAISRYSSCKRRVLPHGSNVLCPCWTPRTPPHTHRCPYLLLSAPGGPLSGMDQRPHPPWSTQASCGPHRPSQALLHSPYLQGQAGVWRGAPLAAPATAPGHALQAGVHEGTRSLCRSRGAPPSYSSCCQGLTSLLRG